MNKRIVLQSAQYCSAGHWPDWTVDTPLANNTAYFWRVRAQRSPNPVQWGA